MEVLLEVFTQLAHWAAEGRGKASSIWLSELLQLHVLFKKKNHIAHCTVIFHNAAGTTLAQSHTKFHSYVHLKQAVKSIVKKEPVTNTNQIYSLQSKIQSKGEKAVLYSLKASSFIPLFIFWNQ